MNSVKLSSAIGATRVTLTIGDTALTVSPEKALDEAGKMIALFGSVPRIDYYADDASGFERDEDAPSTPILDSLAPSPATLHSTFDAPIVDATARTRIESQQAVLTRGGLTGIGHGFGEQRYASGTRLTEGGQATQARRAAMHDRMLPLEDAAQALLERIRSEDRADIKLSARDVGRGIAIVGGRLATNGYVLSDHALRGLVSRIDSPAGGYLSGILDRASTMRGSMNETNGRELLPTITADLNKAADVLQYECERVPSERVQLRIRRATQDCYAILSSTYSPADADKAVHEILSRWCPTDAKGEWRYDPTTTAWELRAQVWTPTPAQEHAVGEPFCGYVSFQSRDNGTGALNGGGGIELVRCLNATTYTSDGASSRRVHKGRILYNIAQMVTSAKRAIDTLCDAWGRARTTEIALPEIKGTGLTIDQAIPGFWRSLLTDRSSELQGILSGRTETHVTGLSRAYHSERRCPGKLVRADMAQGWTRYIQDLPMADRIEAERPIAQWLMSARPMRCEIKERA